MTSLLYQAPKSSQWTSILQPVSGRHFSAESLTASISDLGPQAATRTRPWLSNVCMLLWITASALILLYSTLATHSWALEEEPLSSPCNSPDSKHASWSEESLSSGIVPPCLAPEWPNPRTRRSEPKRGCSLVMYRVMFTIFSFVTLCKCS